MLAWGARGRTFKSCHSDQRIVEIVRVNGFNDFFIRYINAAIKENQPYRSLLSITFLGCNPLPLIDNQNLLCYNNSNYFANIIGFCLISLIQICDIKQKI